MVRSKWSAALALAALPAISVAAEEGARAQLEEVIVTAQK
tara:strand:- start:44276 stop:44395 length:120 start_codon:yes stop_codon:yes gene_type:complete